jgi:hypothetical protein
MRSRSSPATPAWQQGRPFDEKDATAAAQHPLNLSAMIADIVERGNFKLSPTRQSWP